MFISVDIIVFLLILGISFVSGYLFGLKDKKKNK